MTQSLASIDLAGQTVVLTYSNVTAEYEALRRRAIVVNRSHRARVRFSGAKAAEVLSGLVTNDVGALAVGQGQYAAALTPKGKVVADLRILRVRDEEFLTDASARAREGWLAVVRKFVNPRLATYADVSGDLHTVGVFGAQARYVVEEMTGIGHSALGILLPYAHATVAAPGGETFVMRSPELGVDGYELFVPAQLAGETWDAAISARATPAGIAAWEIARVEAGRPEWGIDMDDNTIPQEANLEELGALSYTKGCYTGQEVVARVHFRGHVNRTLRGLRSPATAASGAHDRTPSANRAFETSGIAAAPAFGPPPPSRAILFDEAGKAVGDVRSSVTSPRLGGIALGMVRREIENGAQLTARWGQDPSGDDAPGEMPVEVVGLPFPDA